MPNSPRIEEDDEDEEMADMSENPYPPPIDNSDQK